MCIRDRGNTSDTSRETGRGRSRLIYALRYNSHYNINIPVETKKRTAERGTGSHFPVDKTKFSQLHNKFKLTPTQMRDDSLRNALTTSFPTLARCGCQLNLKENL